MSLCIYNDKNIAFNRITETFVVGLVCQAQRADVISDAERLWTGHVPGQVTPAETGSDLRENY